MIVQSGEVKNEPGKGVQMSIKLCFGLDPSPSLPQPANTSQQTLSFLSVTGQQFFSFLGLSVMILNSPRKGKSDNLGIFQLKHNFISHV